MIAADRPVQRPADARMLVVDDRGRFIHVRRAQFADCLRPGDLVIANDAATLPASLHGVHRPTGGEIEVRLAGWTSVRCDPADPFVAVVFGAGDFRTRTEDRPPPPALAPGDRLEFPSLAATIEGILDHPRLIALRFDGARRDIWAALARHGRPIQYAHMPVPLEAWDVWTPMAARAVAFEAPSASFAIDWRLVAALRERGIDFATVSVAAGISSTGDADLDRRFPLDEPYRISERTADLVRTRRSASGRIVAVGTSVVRALEHSAMLHGDVRSGGGMADGHIGPGTRLRVVDAILSGTHEPGVSHYELLRAFTDDSTLAAASTVLESSGYRTHEFGDSMFVVRRTAAGRPGEAAPEPLAAGPADEGQQSRRENLNPANAV